MEDAREMKGYLKEMKGYLMNEVVFRQVEELWGFWLKLKAGNVDDDEPDDEEECAENLAKKEEEFKKR